MTKEEKIAVLVDELEDIRCDNFDADTDEDKTLKEAVRVIEVLKQEPCEDWCDVPSYEMSLEQARQAVRDLRKFVMDNHILPKLQPCEDAISRQAVLDMMQMKMSGKELYKAVYDLPPIQPKAKVGHWIFAEGIKGKDNVEKCSCCGSHWKEAIIYRTDTQDYLRTRLLFCPNCGAKMEVDE